MVTLEQARKSRPHSVWHESGNPHFIIEHIFSVWALWHTQTGRRVDGFKRKRDALAVAEAMAEHASTMTSIAEMDARPHDPGRRALVCVVNDAYLAATRGLG